MPLPALPLVLVALLLPVQTGHLIEDPDVAVEVVLPGPDWKLSDLSQVQGAVAMKLYSPEAPPQTRFVVIQTPASLARGGIKSRLDQLRPHLEEVPPITRTELAGRDAERIEYVMNGYRSVEIGIPRGESYQVFQVTAQVEDWEDDERGRELRRIFASIRLAPGDAAARPAPLEPFDSTPPDAVRRARTAGRPAERRFAVRAHDVALEIAPAEGSLACRDRFEIEALVDHLDSVALLQTFLEVDSLAFEGESLDWERRAADSHLVIELPYPLDRGERISLEYAAHSDDYFFAVSQQLVAEIEMLGQVRPESSFSSHVHYYPVDAENDGAVRIALTVPEGLTAVTGGNYLGREEAAGTWTWRYETTQQRPRLLPFGFAVGRYEVLRGATEEGLAIELYHEAGDEEVARQYIDLALKSAGLFRQLMGPLPWKRVAFCVVEPERKETGVSLPGLILLSRGFFGDLSKLEIGGAGLSDPALMNWLLVPDELSHQWNAYSIPLPNELAEGISTFTNLLVIEQEAGAEEYLAGVVFCANAYRFGVRPADNVALANPALYRSPGYRVIAFCKVPAALHDLRRRLGDEVFFAGWRRAFRTIGDRETAYEDFRRAFEEESGAELGAWSEGWWFRAGHPRVVLHWRPCEDGEAGVEITLTQVQAGEPFEFEVDVEVRTAAGTSSRHALAVRSREQRATLHLDAAPVEVIVDPDGTSLVELVEG